MEYCAICYYNLYYSLLIYINLQEGGINEEIIEVTELHQMRPQTRMGPMRAPAAINPTIKALLEGSHEMEAALGVEEVVASSRDAQFLSLKTTNYFFGDHIVYI